MVLQRKMSPAISIIIPTYNSDKTLERCLESIVKQDFETYEIIIVDGKSSDKTKDIVIKYASDNTRFRWISESDAGVYDAMNKGIDIAKGEWIYFLGSDDYLHETVLKKLFDNNYPAGVNVVYGSARIAGYTPWALDGQIYDGEFDLKKLLKKNICHQAIFYRRSFVQNEIGYYNLRYKICADWDFNLRCWAKSAFVYKDLIISTFNGGGSSTYNNIDVEFGNNFLQNIIKYFHFSVFDPILNDSNFSFYEDVLKLQNKVGWGRRFVYKCKKKIKSIIH